MPDHDETIFLRDASLEEDVRALVKDVPTHPDRALVEQLDDPEDPEFRLAVHVYPTSLQQADEWIAEIRRRLAESLDITDAPTGADLEALELAPPARRA